MGKLGLIVLGAVLSVGGTLVYQQSFAANAQQNQRIQRLEDHQGQIREQLSRIDERTKVLIDIDRKLNRVLAVLK